MSTLTWHETWNWHIGPLDLDHRRLVEQVADILRRFAATPGDEDGALAETGMMAALERLGEEARLHFRREAEILRNLGDPDLVGQLCEQALLMAEYTGLVRGLREQGARRLDPEAAVWLKGWLVNHVVSNRQFLQPAAGKADWDTYAGHGDLR